MIRFRAGDRIVRRLMALELLGYLVVFDCLEFE